MSTATRTGHWLADDLEELPPGERVFATGVSWDDYVWLSDYRTRIGRKGVRIAYDQGRIELMATSLPHERPLDQLRILILVVCEELDLPCLGAGSTTLRRAEQLRGIEPDACFYLANAAVAVAIDELDLRIHPPPDLAIEVDVTNSSVPRRPIYAGLRVPELWRHDAGTVTFHTLGPGGYTEVPASPAFPTVTSADVSRLLAAAAGELAVPFLRRVRQWVRSLPPQP